MKYITPPEIDQIKMQLWNIFDWAARDYGYRHQHQPSNTMMVNVDYLQNADLFNCSVELEEGLPYSKVYNALMDNLLFAAHVEFVQPRTDDSLQTIWIFSLRFNKRFFFRSLYTPYSDAFSVIDDGDLKYGLPLYKIRIHKGVSRDPYVQYLEKTIPALHILDETLSDSGYELLIGSLYIIPDEQMDFAAPAGYKFGKGREMREKSFMD